jgi:hypothetical protein
MEINLNTKYNNKQNEYSHCFLSGSSLVLKAGKVDILRWISAIPETKELLAEEEEEEEEDEEEEISANPK